MVDSCKIRSGLSNNEGCVREGKMRVRYVFAIVCSIVSRLGGKCEVYQKAAITANGRGSAAVGRRIIERGGSVADAAIATMLCDGVTSSERMGIGGGFVMLIYSHATRTSDVLVAREVAPAAANRYMYANDTIYSLLGGLAVGVPAEIKGYWELHRKYGKISWGELFIPAIEMCYNGVEANDFVTRCRIEFERTVVGCPQIKSQPTIQLPPTLNPQPPPIFPGRNFETFATVSPGENPKCIETT